MGTQHIKIYIINLKFSLDRRKEMIRKMDFFDLEYEFFEAVNGKEISVDVLDEIRSQPYSFKKAFGRDMTLGEIGCAMSHLNLYKKIADEKIDFALILEDDIGFDKRLEFLVNNIRTVEVLKNKFELVLLGYCTNDLNNNKKAEVSIYKRIEIGNGIFFCIPTVWYWLTIGYFITKEGANKLLQQGNLPRMPADFLTTNSPKYKIKLGISNHPIVWSAENSEISLIGDGRGHPNESEKVIEIQKCRPKNLTETLKNSYRNLRSTYHKTKRVMYGKVIKLIPRHYLYVSDKF